MDAGIHGIIKNRIFSERFLPICCHIVFTGMPQLTLRIILPGYDAPAFLMYPMIGRENRYDQYQTKN
jgi:hypothetical protein